MWERVDNVNIVWNELSYFAVYNNIHLGSNTGSNFVKVSVPLRAPI